MTDRNRELFEASDDPVQAQQEVELAIPLRRLGEPADPARWRRSCCSPAAGCLTGITVPVDGGAIGPGSRPAHPGSPSPRQSPATGVDGESVVWNWVR